MPLLVLLLLLSMIASFAHEHVQSDITQQSVARVL